MYKLKAYTLSVFLFISFSGHLYATPFKSDFQVDLKKYTGLWYETARTQNEFQDNTIKKDGESFTACYNSTARYKLAGSDKISVLNTCLRSSNSGKIYKDTIKGFAKAKSNTQGRILQIAFGSGIAQFFQRAISGGGFPYWIYCVGPINNNNQYDWAVVSGPKKEFLFLLTRSKSVSEKKKQEILSCAKKNSLPVSKLIYRQR